ncbi:MAG: hypothetical protein Q4B69_06295 [Slackia sp.]|nr:hypothetical protein [Slackia sp.]
MDAVFAKRMGALLAAAALFGVPAAYADAPSSASSDGAAVVETVDRGFMPGELAGQGGSNRDDASVEDDPDVHAGDGGGEAGGAMPDLAQGWNFHEGRWYWADSPGVAARTGWLYDAGAWYWLAPEANGAMAQDAWIDLADARYRIGSDGVMETGWFFAESDWYLSESNGALVEGWATVDGEPYWLDPAQGGALAVGVFEADGAMYCAVRGGAVVHDDWASVDGSWYYADVSGELHAGWLFWGGSWWWFDPATNAMATGMIEQDGVRYWLGESGAMVTGSFLFDGALRFADATGAVRFEALGWQVVDGKRYFVGDGGIVSTGWLDDEGRRYFLDEQGVMSTGWLQHEGKWYLLGYNGAAASGWHQVSGVWYWLDEATYAMATGWLDINGTWYKFDESGAMETGWIFYAGSWYYCRDDGSMATGWQYIDGSWYWFDETGIMASGGWLQLDDGWYWLYDSGAMATGWINVGGSAYKFDASGRWVEDTGKVLGVSRSRLVNWLLSHRYDGYYLGTPYSSGFSIDTCMHPNGAPRWDGFAGMNCTGFVAQAYASAGGVGELDAIGWVQSYSPWPTGPGGGSYINAWRWYGYAVERGAEMYTFDSVASMLASGKADKGDIIFFKTNGAIDCHIGFFWGDTPYENCMWHQIYPYNCISTCFNNANKGELYQQTVLIKGF